MTELIFRYSYIYEQMLSKISGSNFDDAKTGEGYEYAKRFSEHWKQHNDKVFGYYKSLGLTLPNFWLAYFVSPKKDLIPFSDPLTLIMKEDFDDVTAIAVHELCHVFLDYYANQGIYQKLWDHVAKKYADENFTTKAHLIVNVLARYGLVEIMGPEKTNQLLAKEKNYVGLKRAWEIIDSKTGLFEAKDPVAAILAL